MLYPLLFYGALIISYKIHSNVLHASFKNAGLRRQQLILSWPLSVNEVVFQQEKSKCGRELFEEYIVLVSYLLVPLFFLILHLFLDSVEYALFRNHVGTG